MTIRVDEEENIGFAEAKKDPFKREPSQFDVDTSAVNMNDLMARIRHHVLIHRIRVRHLSSI